MWPPNLLVAVQLCACTHSFVPILTPAWNLKQDDHLALWDEPLYVVAVNSGRREEENDTGI